MDVKQEIKFPYIPMIIISALIGLIGTIWFHLMPASLFNFYNMGYAICIMYFMTAPFILLLMAMVLSKTKSFGKYLTPVNLTYLYALGFMASWFVNPDNMYQLVLGAVVMLRVSSPLDSLKLYPSYVAPPGDIVQSLMNGGGVSWGAWTPTITYWWLYQVAFGLFWISMASILRKQWIDVEKIPFTHTLIAAELLDRISVPQVTPKKRFGRPFAIGILLGMVFQVPIFMASLFPWFPDIYSWRVNTCSTGAQYLTSDSPLAGIVGLSEFQKHPLTIAVAYFAPLGILFSTWVWYLIYIIAAQVTFSMGYYTGLAGMSGCGRAWCAPGEPQEGPPLYFYTLAYRGGLIGLSLMSLFLSRHSIFDTFRAITRKEAVSDKDEAMSYRTAYATLGLTTIAIIAIYMALNCSFIEAILVPITGILYYIAMARIYGSVGLHAAGGRTGWTLYRILLWPTPLSADQAPLSYYITGNWVGHGTDSPNEWFTGSAFYSSFAGYKMANLTEASNRNTTKALLIALIVTPLVAISTAIWLDATYGGSKFAVGSWLSGAGSIPHIVDWLNSSYSGPIAVYTVLGMLITIGLSLLHARFMWFPLDPVGFIVGTSFLSVLWGYWLPFLIAWVLKTMTLRVGGSKLYESLGVPIAAGFIVGCIIAILFGSALGAVYFFHPF